MEHFALVGHADAVVTFGRVLMHWQTVNSEVAITGKTVAHTCLTCTIMLPIIWRVASGVKYQQSRIQNSSHVNFFSLGEVMMTQSLKAKHKADSSLRSAILPSTSISVQCRCNRREAGRPKHSLTGGADDREKSRRQYLSNTRRPSKVVSP
jgi:hypothetical protein